MNSPVDYESTTEYKFTVQASDEGLPCQQSSVQITVIVIDENDNQPIVKLSTPEEEWVNETIVVDETSGMGAVLAIASVEDADSVGLV